MKKVLHLINSGGIYGIEKFLLDLLPSLQSKGLDVMLGCLSPVHSPGAAVGKALAERDVPVIFFDEDRKISLRGLYRIARALKEHHIEVLHTHGYKATVLGGIVSLLASIPLVVTCHAEAGAHGQFSAYFRMEEVFLKRADLVIAVSGKIQDELIERGVPGEKIIVIHNGIKDNFGKIHPKKRTAGPHILSVGRLVELKRYDLALRLLHDLKAEYPGATMTVAGEGPSREKLETLARALHIEDSVRFPGYVHDTASLFRAADLYLLCSDSEGTPITLLEAMSASTPIVSAAVGSIPDILAHKREALIVPAGSAAAMYRAVTRILEDEELRSTLRKNARQTFVNRFQIDAVAERYLNSYAQIDTGTFRHAA